MTNLSCALTFLGTECRSGTIEKICPLLNNGTAYQSLSRWARGGRNEDTRSADYGNFSISMRNAEPFQFCIPAIRIGSGVTARAFIHG